MESISANKENIERLLSNKKVSFLIPDYQRPYAWTETECNTLWNDLYEFAIPEGNADNFNSEKDEYFLGPIVTFKSEDKKKFEIIDGQQRLTTILLLLRAFYTKFELNSMKDKKSLTIKTKIESCIWKTDELGELISKDRIKRESEVATDNDKEQFKSILINGKTDDSWKSRYALNFNFFMEKINEFISRSPSYLAYFPLRIIQNCVFLPILADSQDIALRIFSTLNDRGLPLSDSDIFKAQFYKYYSGNNEKELFINQWKFLEGETKDIFKNSGNPMDELFTRYMYFARAKRGIKSSTTEALRKFYEKDSYAILKSKDTFEQLIDLVRFWRDISIQNVDRFSNETLKKLFVLNSAPNGMWKYFISVYYLQNKDSFPERYDDASDQAFLGFLNKTIAFVLAYGITNPGVNALRTPIFNEMINIVHGKPVTFSDFRFDESQLRNSLNTFMFYNQRPVARSFLTWWAFTDKEQALLDLNLQLDIEHIYPKNRYNNEKPSFSEQSLEKLGNKSLLEKRINIRASDYAFIDKKKYYKGFTNVRGIKKEGTKIHELFKLADQSGFTEKDINDRNNAIINEFIKFVDKEGLLRKV